MSQIAVVTFFGKAGSGKNAAADAFSKFSSNRDILVKQVGFADKIKEIARKYFGWDGVKDEKGRRLLQEIGTAGRKYDPNIWIKHVNTTIINYFLGLNSLGLVLITDGRFPNELEWAKSPWATCSSIGVPILLNRPDRTELVGALEKHESETSLPKEGYAISVDNDGKDLNRYQHDVFKAVQTYLNARDFRI